MSVNNSVLLWRRQSNCPEIGRGWFETSLNIDGRLCASDCIETLKLRVSCFRSNTSTVAITLRYITPRS